jgi:hypothetical protein
MILSRNNVELDLDKWMRDVKICASLELRRADLDGNNSYSETASKGNKPKQVSVAGGISFDNAEGLSLLTAAAELLLDDGSPAVYTVVDRTCRAMMVRQVVFSGRLGAREAEKLQRWDVSFVLKEQRSVNEAIEANARGNTALETVAARDQAAIDAAFGDVEEG